jgi:hypothetical protein
MKHMRVNRKGVRERKVGWHEGRKDREMKRKTKKKRLLKIK